MISAQDEWEAWSRKRSLGCGYGLLTALFGIGLPMVALAVEIQEHLARDIFLDPIPSGFHVGLIAMVPLVMGLALVGLRGALIDFLFGTVLFTCAFYAVAFAPIVPQGLLGIVFYGLGLLPLAPLLAFFTCLLIPNRVVLSGTRMLLGFLFCLLLFLVASWRLCLTRHWEITGDIASLRRWGDADVVYSDCSFSERSGNVAGFFSPEKPQPERAREMYWRMTGRSFVEESPDRPSLELRSSRWDGSVDARAGLAYLEWTAVLHNPGLALEEGRMLLALPPDTVPSRVTLWVNGQEKEAAFAGTAQVTEAYEKVVSTRRDPLLVTSAGPGRIQVRCYPVPPGGEMKFRIGFSTRLAGGQRLLWPTLVHHNLRSQAEHDLRLESKANLIVNRSAPGRMLAGRFPVLPEVKAQAEPESVVCCPRKEGGWLLARRRARPPRGRLAVVIDTSQSMAGHRQEIREALGRLSGALFVMILGPGPPGDSGRAGFDFSGGPGQHRRAPVCPGAGGGGGVAPR